MAGSGHKKVILNTREKWLSTDFNRMQSFVAAHRADIIRYMLAVRTGNAEFGGTLVAAPTDVQGTPLVADVFEGLTVLPQAGKTSLHVVPGVVGMVDPDGTPDPDDSAYKLVVDPGISVDGSLDVGANASGSIRIDVIECMRTTLVTETDNRDIYNPATGLFTPTLVNKAEEGRLIYRVRAGTPGAGYPGPAAGWLPLAVASVPNGSTNTDDVTFWDVRPLISDRWNQPHPSTLGFPQPFEQHNMYTEVDATNGAEVRLMGHVWGEFLGNKLGGRITKGTPGGDVSYVDLRDADNQEPGFALATAGELYYIWTIFPEDLPRWVRYAETPVGGQRVPLGMRGMTIISNTLVDIDSQLPFTAITPPAITGLTNTTLRGRCIAAGKADIIFNPGIMTCPGNGWCYFESNALGAGILPDSTSGVNDKWTLVNGLVFPNNAREVMVRIEFQVTGVIGNDFGYFQEIDVEDTAGTNVVDVPQPGGQKILNQTFISTPETIVLDFIVPRLPPWADPTSTVPNDIIIDFRHSIFGTFTAKSNETLQVIGWRVD